MQNIVMNADFAAPFLFAQILQETQSFLLQTPLWLKLNLKAPRQIMLMLQKDSWQISQCLKTQTSDV